jgi:hypothetical protein
LGSNCFRTTDSLPHKIGSFGGAQIVGFVVITAKIRLVPHFSIWLDLPSLKRRLSHSGFSTMMRYALASDGVKPQETGLLGGGNFE